MPTIGPCLFWFFSSFIVFGLVYLFFMSFIQGQSCKKNWPVKLNFSRMGTNFRKSVSK